MLKKAARHRRCISPRIKIRELGKHRLCIHRTPRHIYAQIIAPDGSHTIASASTLEAQVRKEAPAGGNVEAAKLVGRLVAERARDAGVEVVAFDRSGFRFHGRIKALADAAREAGLRC